MKKIFFLLNGFIFIAVISCFGQGTVRGKITDEKGEVVVGAAIVLKSNMGYGTVTDFDGNYSLKINDATPQVLVIRYVSYASLEVPVTVVDDKVLVKNITLKSESKDLLEVEIVGKASREKDSYMEKMKMNSAASIDYISAETIRKTGDSYVVSAITRVSGVSTTSTGIITVRGISDRYVKTTLNGATIPTLDPFTNNLKLDIFPTSLIDNVTVTNPINPVTGPGLIFQFLLKIILKVYHFLLKQLLDIILNLLLKVFSHLKQVQQIGWGMMMDIGILIINPMNRSTGTRHNMKNW